MKTIALFLILCCFVSCQEDQPQHFGDFVNISKIEKVVMSNNSGKFELLGPQLEMFKRELENLTPATGSYKTGGLTIVLTIKRKEYVLSTNTHGEYLECPVEIISENKKHFKGEKVVYFKMNGVNFDNFKP